MPLMFTQRLRKFRAALLPAVLLLASGMRAQSAAPLTNVKDSAPLKPPAGYRVAIVEWQDMECPVCARAFPIAKEDSESSHVPWVEHEFPIRYHVWSRDAAIDARFFEGKSKAVADEFRGEIFAAQPFLHTKDDIKTFAQKFASQHGIQWPFVVDPQGNLAAAVQADEDLGLKVGIDHTPSIFVVTNGANGAQQYREVQDYSQMAEMLRSAIQQVGGVKEPSATKPMPRRK